MRSVQKGGGRTVRKQIYSQILNQQEKNLGNLLTKKEAKTTITRKPDFKILREK